MTNALVLVPIVAAAIVALVPVDLSFDAVAGRVQGFSPLAASLYLGYRLDL